MKKTELYEGIGDLRLGYLLLAQRMIRDDRAAAAPVPATVHYAHRTI